MLDKKHPLANGTRNLADEDLTQAVLATFSNSRSERYQQIMQAFVKDVELTGENPAYRRTIVPSAHEAAWSAG